MNNACVIHIDEPNAHDYAPLLRTRGWVVSHYPIDQVVVNDTLLEFEDRPDVSKVYPQFAHTRGFVGSLNPESVEHEIVFTVHSNGEHHHRHAIAGGSSAQRRIAELENEVARLQTDNDSLRSQLSEARPLPVPDEHLRVRIGNRNDSDHFLGVGRKLYWDIKQQLHCVDRTVHDFTRVLDFGCGCGRVIRYFEPGSLNDDPRRLTGIDIDPEAVDWCQRNLGSIGEFVTIQPDSSTPFADNVFDLIYGISVLTHLPEDMQFFWLSELQRITQPGGIVVLSVHGPELLGDDTPADTLTAFEKKGFHYRIEPVGTDGLPDFYQTAFHSDSYIYDRWSAYFNILNINWRGFNFHQNAVVLQKPL